MTFEEYRKEVELFRAPLKTQGLDIIHMLMGIHTELGELMDIYKKKLAYNKEIDTTNVLEEAGDLLFYTGGLLNVLKLETSTVLERNIEKLSARYPGKVFSAEKALNRDLDTERKILEGES